MYFFLGLLRLLRLIEEGRFDELDDDDGTSAGDGTDTGIGTDGEETRFQHCLLGYVGLFSGTTSECEKR